MITINDLCFNSCKTEYSEYKSLSKNIFLINDFFKNFELAKKFFNEREKWNCISFSENSKPGIESVFPNWVGKYLMDKFIVDNEIPYDLRSFDIVCNLFYQTPNSWSLTNTGLFPHYDLGESFDGYQKQICLINLNDIPISTRFYSFDSVIELKKSDEKEWNEYDSYITSQYFQYCEDKKISKFITREQVQNFFEENNQKVRFKLIDEIWYQPNQCIIYPANMLHSANISDEFSVDNPRTSIRVTFDKKIDNFLETDYDGSQSNNVKKINVFYE